jgi:hypothetical protein
MEWKRIALQILGTLVAVFIVAMGITHIVAVQSRRHN